MIKPFFTTLAIVTTLSVWAQKPNYVPFHYQGKTGITHVDGTEFLSPGSFGNYHLVVGDFKSYIVQDNVFTRNDFFFNASRGEGEVLSGEFDLQAGRLAVGNDTYYHFWMDGISVMYSPAHGVTPLQRAYSRIEPNHQAWANERRQGRQLIWALKSEGGYDILDAEQGFSVIEGLPDFYSYDLLFQSSETEPMKLVGFALGDFETIERNVGQMYGIPESEGKVDVYDIQFKKLGSSAYRAKDISALFDQAVQLRGGMMPPPQMKNQVISPDGNIVILNDEFRLIPDENNSARLILVNSKKNNEPVLGNGDFDYRYFSTSDHLKALLQIRHRESRSIFYFDFDGTFFPRGVPMIPKHRMDWE